MMASPVRDPPYCPLADHRVESPYGERHPWGWCAALPERRVGGGLLPSSLPGGAEKGTGMFLKLKHLECFTGELETEQPSQGTQDR